MTEGRTNWTTLYEQAVVKYTHEDSLLWLKVQSAILVNAGLATVFGIQGAQPHAHFICVAGTTVNLFLAWSLWNGTKYLSHRQKAVYDIAVKSAPDDADREYRPSSPQVRLDSSILMCIITSALTLGWGVFAWLAWPF